MKYNTGAQLSDLEGTFPDGMLTRIKKEWESKCEFGFGNPQIRVQIIDNGGEPLFESSPVTKMIDVMISFQGSADVYKYSEINGIPAWPSDHMHLTEEQVKWMAQFLK